MMRKPVYTESDRSWSSFRKLRAEPTCRRGNEETTDMMLFWPVGPGGKPRSLFSDAQRSVPGPMGRSHTEQGMRTVSIRLREGLSKQRQAKLWFYSSCRLTWRSQRLLRTPWLDWRKKLQNKMDDEGNSTYSSDLQISSVTTITFHIQFWY